MGENGEMAPCVGHNVFGVVLATYIHILQLVSLRPLERHFQ